MAESITSRSELLIGKENLDKLAQAKVLVLGVGGVGSYACEALARTGVGKLVLIDKDQVSLSNCNRQIMATKLTVDQSKTSAMKERIMSYSDTEVICVDGFFDESIVNYLEGVDFAIDAIDTCSSKVLFIQECLKRKIPFVCSLGMGNRLDPSKVTYTYLKNTYGDPFAKAMRTCVKKAEIEEDIPVLFSSEEPITQNKVVEPSGSTRKDRIPPASCVFVPAAAGLLAASVAVRTIIGKEIHVDNK